MHRQSHAAVACAIAALVVGPAAARADDVLAGARQVIAAATAPASKWDGPTTGPKAVPGKLIVYVAADERNGGIQEVGHGVQQAGARIGWTVRVLDGQGTVSGIQSAFGEAVTLKPAGIIVGGYDVVQNAGPIADAERRGIRIVAWHGGPAPGPMAAQHVFTNVTSDSARVAKVAADYAIAKSDGHAGVVIFTDSSYAIALAKARAMEAEVKRCAGCTVLAFEDTPLADTSTRMPQLTTTLVQRYGKKWTWSLAINDLYYDFMGPSLISAGRDGGGPPMNVSAGDGSRSAFERIRNEQFQTATVPEPLLLQGWQLIDELNRAFAGAPPSGYVAPVHLVTASDIDEDGGKQDRYDPANGYRDAYARIWGR